MAQKLKIGSGVAWGTGAEADMRGGKEFDLIVSELHGRFGTLNYDGLLNSGGMTLTSINNATFTTATLGVTCTPILGIYNPLNNTVIAEILQATLQMILTALATTGPGALMWATSTGNNAISTGNVPLNRKTLAATGSSCKDMSGIALTGLTNNLVVRGASAMNGGSLYNISGTGTPAGFQTVAQGQVENIDGAWFVPPGGVLALLATTTPVAHSAAGGLLWGERPL